ncbi:DoxX family protein [Nocardia lijiangensis]|uniref:DoxX family protein n=1 Tax=Nocardia lijiangensis TaxID=299618 RepID=UPI0008335CDE|nr:DoxX family protein [Nocardia lijiangensis]
MNAIATEVRERDGEDVVDPSLRWSLPARIGFRFCFTYLMLFCLTFAQILFVFAGVAMRWLPDSAIRWQMEAVEPVARWTGEHVFGVDAVIHESGSGDQTIIWVLIFCMLVVAAVGTVIWTVLDRRRTDYAVLGRWFVTFLRLCLGGQMLWYGFAKAVPIQMPYPSLTTLLEPYGNLSMTDVLWNQVGASPSYQVLLGIAEVLGGLLLFWPRTATAGAMLSLVSMAQVFVLNMTYDVPVKILSFHLMLISLVVLAPQARRLANVLVLERSSEPATQPSLFRSVRANRIAAALQVALGLWTCSGAAWNAWDAWHEYGYGAPKPALYGIWNVTEFTVDGHPLPPLTTEPTRWQRLVFDTFATSYQRMDGTFVPALADVDTGARTLTMTAPPTAPDSQPTRVATFTFERPEPGRLALRGDLGGRPVTLTLEEFDLNEFPLRGERFHWIQEIPNLG